MDNQGPNNYNNGNNNYNNNGGNGGGGNGNNGGNGGKDNHNGQLIMAFVLVSLIVLFIMSMVSNRFSQMSTQEISYSQFLEKVEAGEVKSVEIGSYEIDITPVTKDKSPYQPTYYCGRVADEDLIPLLKEYYTVYTIDLLGCGRSEKPNLTYTNFLYVQLLNDFVKSEIGRRTNIVATGASAPIVTMACGYNPDLFEQMMFINPDSLLSCSHIPGKSAKCYKFILDLPIIGTLLYNFASARSIISKTFSESYFYNPYDVNPHNIDKYHESAHLGDSPKSVYASVQCNYTKCNITKTLEKIDNSIYILGGEAEPDIDLTIKEYTKCNPAIESSTIANTRHLPQLENPEEVSATVQMFFN